MNNDKSINSYKRFYEDLNFDRAGLFETIKKEYGCNTVIYPGCSIHITPSFYFQHVVYVDISKTAKEFFNDTQNVVDYINSNRKYKQFAYIQFIHGDYTKALPIRNENYDLLIALYAGEITKSCKKYVRTGGIILTNNHHKDAEDLLKDSSITLDGMICKKRNKYVIDKNINGDLKDILKNHSNTKKDMKNTNNGLEYADNQCYFVLKKNK
ncbi:MAG TPA: class I SAM-dependent methyltransferase [Clostridiaceae bacterium]|nr:class I SAM-dependent methyltransferase [Clostridiaceae bacterium]